MALSNKLIFEHNPHWNISCSYLGGLIYWSMEEVLPDEVFIQNQRPYIIPRKKNKFDARNVETTAYALLTYIRREGFIQDRIVEWLVKVKYSDAGFCSTRVSAHFHYSDISISVIVISSSKTVPKDTLVAMEALIEYSYRSRVREVTDLQVKIEASSLPGMSKIFRINQDNLSKQQKIVVSFRCFTKECFVQTFDRTA